MNFFIIGNASSVWMKEYIKEVHIRNNDEVYLTVYDKSALIYEDEYKKMGVTLIVLGNSSSKLEKLKKAMRLIKLAFNHRKKNCFDLVEIQSPPHNFQSEIIAAFLKIIKTKSFLMFWGSDILSINDKEAGKLERIVENVTSINRLSDKTYNVFKQHFGNKYDDKFTLSPLRFGTLAIPYIKDMINKSSVIECKKRLGINHNKITIAIGYNGKRRHQHIRVMKEMNKLSKSVKESVHLIFHLVGYEDEGYIDQIREETESIGISYTIIKESLEFEEISTLRIATDVFLHAQTTDGLSGTIRECLYAGTVVVNPVWINYDELKAVGIEYIEYSDFGEIPSIVNRYLKGSLKVDVLKNRKLISELHSWDGVYDNWIRTFYDIITE